MYTRWHNTHVVYLIHLMEVLWIKDTFLSSVLSELWVSALIDSNRFQLCELCPSYNLWSHWSYLDLSQINCIGLLVYYGEQGTRHSLLPDSWTPSSPQRMLASDTEPPGKNFMSSWYREPWLGSVWRTASWIKLIQEHANVRKWIAMGQGFRFPLGLFHLLL